MNWLFRRLGQAVFTVWLVVSFTFVLIRQLPGGPIEYIRAQLLSSQGGSMTTAERERINGLAEAYVNIRPDAPLWQQYLDYVTSILTGDLGRSIYFDQSIIDLIAQRLPWTLFVMSIAILLTFGFGVLFGAIMAYQEGSKLDIGLSVSFTLFNSIPYYVVAVLAVYILGYQLGWFPTGGRISGDYSAGFTLRYIGDVFRHAFLPVTSLVVTGAGGRAIGMRGNSVRVMGEDFLRVAKLRGLSSRRIALHYVGRNAVLPMYTNFLIAIGFLFGGAVILEQIFSYEGVGILLLRGVRIRDYPLMMGTFLIITIAVVVGVFIADLTYGKLDPRVEAGRSEAQ